MVNLATEYHAIMTNSPNPPGNKNKMLEKGVFSPTNDVQNGVVESKNGRLMLIYPGVEIGEMSHQLMPAYVRSFSEFIFH